MPAELWRNNLHLSCCHYYAWVFKVATGSGGYKLTFDERTSIDLTMYQRPGCERCKELALGAEARHYEYLFPVLPDDAAQALHCTMLLAGQLDMYGEVRMPWDGPGVRAA